MEGEQSSTKKLRYADPDLRVIVGNDEGSQKEYHYHSAILASQSTYIDAMLASPMREGSDFVLTFPDLEPDTWEAMMKFLEPAEAYTMNVTNAQTLAVVYDKYDFFHGRACCDVILSEYIQKKSESIEGTNTLNQDYETLAKMYQVAHDCHLPKSVESGTNYFVTAFNNVEEKGENTFTVPLLEKVGPLIGQAKTLEFLENCFCTPEKASLSTFPRDFMEWWKLIDRVKSLETHIKSHEERVVALTVTISHNGSAMLSTPLRIENKDIRQKMVGKGNFVFQRSPTIFFFSVSGGDSEWKWKCQRSGDWENLPPESGWEPRNVNAVGLELDVKYDYSHD